MLQRGRKLPGGRNPRTLGESGTVMRRWIRNNSLSLVLILLFVLTWVGQSVAGFRQFVDEQQAHGAPKPSYGEYLAGDHFWEATAENWESEFFQMFVYVALTAFLYQKGSAESKDPDTPDEEAPRVSPDSPWPVRKGGWWLRVYEHSLSLAFAVLFVFSFAVHAYAGCRAYSEEQNAHGEPSLNMLQYLGSSRFWFESFQNWQSEFLAIAAMVILTIYLREKASPESKPVQMPHDQNPE